MYQQHHSHHTHQKAFCALHNIRRFMNELIDAGDGTFRCLPSNECREIEMKMCAQHQRMRPAHQLEEIQPGVFQCSSSNPCRDGGRAGVYSSSSNAGGDGGGRGGFFGGRGGARGGQSYYSRGGGGRGGAGSDGNSYNTNQSDDQQQQHQHYSARNFYAAGAIREREGEFSSHNNGLGDFAASGVKFAQRAPRGGFSSQNIVVSGNNRNFGAMNEVQIRAANEAINAKFGDQGDVGFFASSNKNINLSSDDASAFPTDKIKSLQQQQLLAMFNRQQQQQLLAGSHAKVWCCKHGREIELRSAKSIDGGMTFMCADSTECLGAPLDDPKALAAKGCGELWCKVHKRLRGPKWLSVAPDNSGFICKRPHGCRPVIGLGNNNNNNSNDDVNANNNNNNNSDHANSDNFLLFMD